jgi:hypothetical protein
MRVSVGSPPNKTVINSYYRRNQACTRPYCGNYFVTRLDLVALGRVGPILPKFPSVACLPRPYFGVVSCRSPRGQALTAMLRAPNPVMLRLYPQRITSCRASRVPFLSRGSLAAIVTADGCGRWWHRYRYCCLAPSSPQHPASIVLLWFTQTRPEEHAPSSSLAPYHRQRAHAIQRSCNRVPASTQCHVDR